MKNVVLLGSTGSIGTSTVKVAEDLPDQIRLVGLAAGNNSELLLEQTRKHRPDWYFHYRPGKGEGSQSCAGQGRLRFSAAQKVCSNSPRCRRRTLS